MLFDKLYLYKIIGDHVLSPFGADLGQRETQGTRRNGIGSVNQRPNLFPKTNELTTRVHTSRDESTTRLQCEDRKRPTRSSFPTEAINACLGVVTDGVATGTA